MKLAALLLVSAFILSPSLTRASISNKIDINSDSSSGDTSIKVNINNQMGTSQTSTSVKSQSSVRIHQSNDGASEVKINGEEYKLEGLGDINIDNSSDDYLLPTKTPTPTQNPALSDTETPSTQSESHQVLGSSDINVESSGVIEIVVNTCIKILRNFTSFF